MNGSRLDFTVPLNNKGSWGTIANRDRSSRSGISSALSLSKYKDPEHGSIVRNKQLIKLDLPAPFTYDDYDYMLII